MDDPRLDFTEFRFWKSLFWSVVFGSLVAAGTLYRATAIDGGELTLEVVREYAVIAPVAAAGLFFLSWLIPTFNKHFPRRDE